MLYPTLVIALGGTGSNVVANLRRRLFLTYGSYTPQSKVAYLVIDTDLQNSMTRGNEGIRLDVSDDITTQLMNPESHLAARLRISQWLDPDLGRSLTTDKFAQGVGGIRMLGRLAFLASPQIATIFTRLTSILQQLHQRREGDQAPAVKVLVVASGGGGTGSGCFLDMGYLIRETVARMTPPILYQMEGIAAIAVPDMQLSDPKKARNSAALLHELDHFSQDLYTFEAHYPFGSLRELAGRNAPYPYITLVSPTYDYQRFQDADTGGEPMKMLEEKIADYLYLRMTDPIGINGLDARLRDLGENWNIVGKDNKGYPNRFMTFGVALRQFPSGLLRRISECQAYGLFARQWIKEAREGSALISEELISQGGELYSRFYGDLEEVKGWLGLPTSFHKQPRFHGTDSLYNKLVGAAGQSLHEALIAAHAGPALDEQFKYQGERHPLVAGTTGYIVGVMTANRDKLVQRNDPDSLINSVTERLWRRTFTLPCGPRYALALISELDTAIEQEIQHINYILDQHRAGGASHTAAAKANLMFEDCLIERKRDVLQAVVRVISREAKSVRQRLDLLIAYIDDWTSDRMRDAQHANGMLARLHDSEFAEEARRAQKTDITISIADQAYRELENLARKDSFGERLPQGGDGKTDFSALQSLDAAIQQRVREEQMPSALSLMAARNGGDWQADCDKLARESRPLLALRLDAEGYGELKFGTFQDKLTRWIATAYQGTDVGKFRGFRDGLRGSELDENKGAEPRRIKEAVGAADIEVVEGEEPSVVGMIFQRVAFPSRIIAGYDYEDRMRLLNPSDANLTTPYTQSQIMAQVDPKRRKQAEQVLLLAEALRRMPGRALQGPRIEHDQGQHIYYYKPISPSQPDRIVYAREFDRAVQRVAAQTHAFRQMSSEIARLVQPPDDRGEIKALLKEHREALIKFRAMHPNEKYAYYEGFDFERLDYQAALDAITDWMIANDLEPRGDHPWAKLTFEGWKCASCGRPQGTTRPDEMRGCPNCGFIG